MVTFDAYERTPDLSLRIIEVALAHTEPFASSNFRRNLFTPNFRRYLPATSPCQSFLKRISASWFLNSFLSGGMRMLPIFGTAASSGTRFSARRPSNKYFTPLAGNAGFTNGRLMSWKPTMPLGLRQPKTARRLIVRHG